MINALFLNCQILALNTIFNIEMLQNKKAIFFEKNIDSVTKSIQLMEQKHISLDVANKYYKIPDQYNWDFIVNQYLKSFNSIIS